jgi:hypothetical protein
MARKKMLNGVLVNYTAEEEAQADIDKKKWEDESASRKLTKIKQIRLQKLQKTDWMATSDVTMPDYIKTWRQTLRDLPQNNTSESQYDALLERNADGSLKNSVWTQPTS